MRRTMGALGALVLCTGVFAAGCEKEDDPVLIVSSQYGSNSQMYVDGNHIGDVPPNGEASWEIGDGNHTFSASSSVTAINGDVSDGAKVRLLLDGGGNLKPQ